MRNLLRRVLRNVLKILAKLAIRKHKIRIIAVSGWAGTGIVKESLYQIIKEDYVVRRNVNKVDWDLSVPLAILGYKDLKYSFRGWFQILFSTIWVLLFERTNPHMLILELNADNIDTYRYWLSILTPEILILVNSRKGMEEAEKVLIYGLKDGGLVVSSPDKALEIAGKFKQEISFKTFGDSTDIEYDYTYLQEKLVTGGGEYSFSVDQPEFVKKSMLAAISVSDYLNIDIDKAISRLEEFEIPGYQFAQIMKKMMKDE